MSITIVTNHSVFYTIKTSQLKKKILPVGGFFLCVKEALLVKHVQGQYAILVKLDF